MVQHQAGSENISEAIHNVEPKRSKEMPQTSNRGTKQKQKQQNPLSKKHSPQTTHLDHPLRYLRIQSRRLGMLGGGEGGCVAEAVKKNWGGGGGQAI